MATFYRYWDEFGSMMMCIGCNTNDHCSIDTVFLISVDVTKHIKNTEYICQLMYAVVEVSPSIVVHIVIDNDANFKVDGTLLMECRSHILWIPYANDYIDLMLMDIEKEAEVRHYIDLMLMDIGCLLG